MNLRPSTTHHRDLTDRLPALNHRLSRDERRFEPLAGERFSDDAHMPPGGGAGWSSEKPTSLQATKPADEDGEEWKEGAGV